MLIPNRTINVYVTGNGPYPDGNGGHIDHNTSHLVTKLLPISLPAKSNLNPTGANIQFLNPTAQDENVLKTEYGFIRSYLKTLHDKHTEDVDIFIHLGEASGWDFVSIERMAFKQGMSSDWWSHVYKYSTYYVLPDNIGENINDIGPCPWDDKVPIGLSTAFDVDAVSDKAREVLQKMYDNHDDSNSHREESSSPSSGPIAIKPHFEAGFYCCGFIYYESLANCYVRKRVPHVLFCHLPGEAEEVSLKRARDAVVAVVVAAVSEFLKVETKYFT